MNPRRLPPYGKTACPLAACGKHFFVMTGPDGWMHARAKQVSFKPDEPPFAPVLVCPDDQSPYNYQWPVSGMAITVIDSGAGDEKLAELGRALIQDGATLVAICPEMGRRRAVIFRPQEVRNAA